MLADRHRAIMAMDNAEGSEMALRGCGEICELVRDA